MIQVNEPAPPFELQDQEDRTRSLGDYRGRWVVLYFYPRDATPGCTRQACGFRDALDSLGELDAVVLGVSPDPVASHRKFAAKQGLSFPLLSDDDHRVCEAYGVWQEKSMYGRTYWGVVRTTYLIDPAGNVAERWDKVRVGGHVELVRQRIRDLRDE